MHMYPRTSMCNIHTRHKYLDDPLIILSSVNIFLMFCLVINDCKAAQTFNLSSSDDVYLVYIEGRPTSVRCDMNTVGGGWTVSLI